MHIVRLKIAVRVPDKTGENEVETALNAALGATPQSEWWPGAGLWEAGALVLTDDHEETREQEEERAMSDTGFDLKALLDAERTAREGCQTAYPLYKSGPVIANGTINAHEHHDYNDDGLRGAVNAACEGSRSDSLLHVAVRRISGDQDTIVAAFEDGRPVPVEVARIVAANGYTETAAAALQAARETPRLTSECQGIRDDEDEAQLSDLTMAGKRRCYWIPAAPYDENGYVPSAITEDEPGHAPMAGNGTAAAPWYWGKTRNEALAICEKANADLGLTPADAAAILMSSLRAQTREAEADFEDKVAQRHANGYVAVVDQREHDELIGRRPELLRRLSFEQWRRNNSGTLADYESAVTAADETAARAAFEELQKYPWIHCDGPSDFAKLPEGMREIWIAVARAARACD